MSLFKNDYLTFKTYFCIRSQLEFNRIARALKRKSLLKTFIEIYTQNLYLTAKEKYLLFTKTVLPIDMKIVFL
jgi:hypothetical protein